MHRSVGSYTKGKPESATPDCRADVCLMPGGIAFVVEWHPFRALPAFRACALAGRVCLPGLRGVLAEPASSGAGCATGSAATVPTSAA